MSNTEIELDPVDFVTVGTVGPKGRRLFHLQAGRANELVSMILEKEQARALAEAIGEMLDDLSQKYPERPEGPEVGLDMTLRDPVDPLFRIAQLGLGYDEDRNMVLLVAQELVVTEDEEEEGTSPEAEEPQVVRMWATREQMRAFTRHVQYIVKQGRANPKTNGHLIYYWT
jgi:uncharacterized repeat protein (TIGR03847 family)